MYLKKLELAGFKSFAKKTALDFTSPITAIVGPNGSGKSNIVEAIRFVLGEQSIKSMRGKSGSDLIFKGSKSINAMNRASVSITFDNRSRIFSFAGRNDAPNISFDEITISREVFSDGANKYSLNGSEVRLKDIVELLASVNIGTSGHHIISQGEADRILNANAKERRGMIEDALGLKIYQYKIRESERKLEKTIENMKDVQSLRREIAPHITFLKKQVEKIEKAEEMRRDLSVLYKKYLANENAYINQERNKIESEKGNFDAELRGLNEKISMLERQRGNVDESPYDRKAKEISENIDSLRTVINELERKLGRLEALLEVEERGARGGGKSTEAIPFSKIENIFSDLDLEIEKALSSDSLLGVQEALRDIRIRINRFLREHKENSGDILANEGSRSEIEKLKDEHEAIKSEIEKIKERERGFVAERDNILAKKSEEEKQIRAHEREYYEMIGRRNELKTNMSLLVMREENIRKETALFENELREGAVLVGPEAVRFSDVLVEKLDRVEQEEAKRKIERLKIKLEDAGGAGGSEIMKEFEETKNRDDFLVKELADLETSISTLRDLVSDLKTTLDREFRDGVEKINTQFQEFFSLMFGGGNAFLSVIVEQKKKRRSEDDDEEIIDEEDAPFEEGLEINVSMPHKKVKELQMLSGGERSLTSIALLFAVSQVNPPPFLVLDETDAALDEANSRKYGNMLENLSKYSELIVVTHNRETMSRAQVLYGITIGSDGASKMLSIKFDEAVAIAK